MKTKWRTFWDHIWAVISDTLKKQSPDGSAKWSRTSLTMFTAWAWVFVIASADYVIHGFKFNVWAAMLGVATGVKLADAAYQAIKRDKPKGPQGPEPIG